MTTTVKGKPFKEAPVKGACPHCGRGHWHFQVASPGVSPERQKRPGDISLCRHCAGVGIVGDDLKTRLPTVMEIAEMASDRTLMGQVAALRIELALAPDELDELRKPRPSR